MSKLLNKDNVAILLLMVFLVCSFVQPALSEGLPDSEKVAKLVAAAWKNQPNSIDATVYETITRPAKSRQQIQEEVEDFFAKDKSQILQEYEPNSHGRTVMLEKLNSEIEMNVERIMKEQQTPTQIKDWTRISDGRERHDVSYARTPDITLGPNTPFESTFVDLRQHVEGNIKAFSYQHIMKEVMINNKGWKKSNITKFSGLSSYFQGFLGVNQGTISEPVFVPDPNKMEKLRKTGFVAGRTHLTISPDPNNPDTRDRIEIKDPNYPGGTIMICDREDYSRVYYMKTCMPKTEKVLYVRECNNFDSYGFPHNITEIQYDIDGNLKEKSVYRIEKVELNPVIPDEVFKFNPPEGYKVTDLRSKKP